MDRMEEYAALQAQLEEHPSALAYTVQRARARRARRRRLRRFGVPLGSLAGAMAHSYCWQTCPRPLRWPAPTSRS